MAIRFFSETFGSSPCRYYPPTHMNSNYKNQSNREKEIPELPDVVTFKGRQPKNTHNAFVMQKYRIDRMYTIVIVI
jgi:hypothetical protein